MQRDSVLLQKGGRTIYVCVTFPYSFLIMYLHSKMQVELFFIYYLSLEFSIQTPLFGCHGDSCRHRLHLSQTETLHCLIAAFQSPQMHMSSGASPVPYKWFCLFDDEARTELEPRLSRKSASKALSCCHRFRIC